MDWLLVIVYVSSGAGVFVVGTGAGGFSSVESVHRTREECQLALEAYAKKSSSSALTLVCLEGEKFEPVPKRVRPSREATP